MMLKRLQGCVVASKGLKTFRDAGYTRVQKDGNETVWFRNGIPDPEGRRCYCVVFQDMSLNDIVIMTKQQAFMLELKHGENIVISDWTIIFNKRPDMLKELTKPKYGACITEGVTYEDIYNYNDAKEIARMRRG